MIECDKVGFSISFPSVFHVQKKPTSYKPWGNNFIVLFIFFLSINIMTRCIYDRVW